MKILLVVGMILALAVTVTVLENTSTHSDVGTGPAPTATQEAAAPAVTNVPPVTFSTVAASSDNPYLSNLTYLEGVRRTPAGR
jgi:hypothetical protein